MRSVTLLPEFKIEPLEPYPGLSVAVIHLREVYRCGNFRNTYMHLEFEIDHYEVTRWIGLN